ncbi:MAG: DUF4924 family protein [Muribaculaceae bacterium]|nr:DUF4924 family protein [Muribaculaceae bacterium]
MFIASDKRKKNIAEYLLYMWQVEDIIRANNLDIEKIRKNIIDRFDLSQDQHRQLTEWYESLIDMMRREGVEKSGHLQINVNTISQLVELHNALLSDPRFGEYTKRFYAALPAIVELRSKAGENPSGEIETCFNALYGMLILRLRSGEVTQATAEAIANISAFISMLASYFHKNEKEDIFKEESED